MPSVRPDEVARRKQLILDWVNMGDPAEPEREFCLRHFGVNRYVLRDWLKNNSHLFKWTPTQEQWIKAAIHKFSNMRKLDSAEIATRKDHILLWANEGGPVMSMRDYSRHIIGRSENTLTSWLATSEKEFDFTDVEKGWIEAAKVVSSSGAVRKGGTFSRDEKRGHCLFWANRGNPVMTMRDYSRHIIGRIENTLSNWLIANEKEFNFFNFTDVEKGWIEAAKVASISGAVRRGMATSSQNAAQLRPEPSHAPEAPLPATLSPLQQYRQPQDPDSDPELADQRWHGHGWAQHQDQSIPSGPVAPPTVFHPANTQQEFHHVEEDMPAWPQWTMMTDPSRDVPQQSRMQISASSYPVYEQTGEPNPPAIHYPPYYQSASPWPYGMNSERPAPQGRRF